METNRIDVSFAQAARGTAAKSTNSGVGFADLLLGAMKQGAGAIGAEQSQSRLAEVAAPRRRFDDYPLHQVEFRDPGEAHVDRRVGNEHSRSRWNVSESDSTNPGRGALARIERPANSRQPDHPLACPEESATPEVTEIEAPADAAAESDTAEADRDISTSDEGGAGDAASDPGADSGSGGAQEGLGLTSAIAPTAEEAAPLAGLIVDSVAPSNGEVTSIPLAAAPGGDTAETEKTVEDAARATASIAATLPQPQPDSAEPETKANAAPSGQGMPAPSDGEENAPVTFSAALAATEATEESTGTAALQGQAAAIPAKGERQIDDAGSSFRRHLSGGRRGTSEGAGTTPGANSGGGTGAAAQALAETQGAKAPAATSLASNAPSGMIPVGFDTGLGEATGLPGWNFHLAQGAAARRGDFVANLRQHLQNLPVQEQVALSIQRSARDGGGSITLQLSPSELGRIHLKLEIDEEKNVQAAVTVERPATLELLQRDMKALERALQEAGLKAGPGDLSFSLQGGDPEAFARDFGSGNGSGAGGGDLANENGAEADPSATPAPVIATGDGWVDVQV
jgi:flagellar hook-length control protein FliK